MVTSGGFSLGFSPGFDVYSISGVLDPALISHYWLTDFNKKQEIYTTWNK